MEKISNTDANKVLLLNHLEILRNFIIFSDLRNYFTSLFH